MIREINYQVGAKYQLMFPQVNDVFFYNGELVYVTEVWNDGARLSNGETFLVGDWIRKLETSEIVEFKEVE